MKAEEELNTEVVEESLPMLFAGRKSEMKVSFVPVCSLLVYINTQNRVLPFLFSSVCLWLFT
jgi:hypothetical protein